MISATEANAFSRPLQVSLAAWRCCSLCGELHQSQRLGDLCIAHIGVAVDIGENFPFESHDLEAASV